MAGFPYPAELPAPVSAPFRPARRVRRSEFNSQVNQAARERDFRGRDQLGFVFGDAITAERWQDWWLYELGHGAKLFSTAWPLPSGLRADVVRKFITAPVWTPVGRGIWRVSIESEIVGRYAELRGGFDARAANWPGTIEYAVRDGDLVTDVTVPWTWDTPDITWDDYYGWAGFIGYVYATSDLGAVRPTWARVTASADQPITIERAASDDGSTWGAWVVVPNGGGAAPTRFDARYVRIRIRVPNDDVTDTAALTAARIAIFQRT